MSAQTSDIQGINRQRRVILPTVRQVGNLFGRLTPTRSMDSLRKQLTIAGSPYGLGTKRILRSSHFIRFHRDLAWHFYVLRREFSTINILAGFAA
jgi:hypothetical protein